jgi:BTB/POZ domain
MAVVDFIYKGEVSVEDNQLASFLTTAELLEVQGLTNHHESVDPNKIVIEVSSKLNILCIMILI